MLCEICKKKPATIHIQEIIGNQKKTIHLCQDCATKKAQEDSTFQAFNLAEVLYNISNQIGENGEKTSDDLPEQNNAFSKIFCPVCGWDYAGFRKTGRLGCPDCYSAFYKVLKTAIGAMHRGTIHLGKKPLTPATKTKIRKRKITKTMIKSDITRMQKDLDEAVLREQYEEAAILRDKINTLKAQLEKKDK